MKLILNKFLASEETCCCHNQCLPPTTTTVNRNSRRLSSDAAAVISFILIFFNVIKLEICFYVSDSADKNLCSPLTSPPLTPGDQVSLDQLTHVNINIIAWLGCQSVSESLVRPLKWSSDSPQSLHASTAQKHSDDGEEIYNLWLDNTSISFGYLKLTQTSALKKMHKGKWITLSKSLLPYKRRSMVQLVKRICNKNLL